jgi:uncharacterized protein YqgC (DUF456 family)
MDSMLIIIGFCCMLIGVIGAFFPFAWSTYELDGLALLFTTVFQQTIGFSALHYCNHYHFNIRIYYPVQRNKTIRRKFLWHLGNKYRTIVGLLSPIPFGFLIGAFAGALIGELLYDSKTTNALKAAAGSFIDS